MTAASAGLLCSQPRIVSRPECRREDWVTSPFSPHGLQVRGDPRDLGETWSPGRLPAFQPSPPSSLSLEGKWTDFASAEIFASLGFTFFCCGGGFPLNPPTVSGLLLPAAPGECVLIPALIKHRRRKHKPGLSEAGRGTHWDCWQNAAAEQTAQPQGGQSWERDPGLP